MSKKVVGVFSCLQLEAGPTTANTTGALTGIFDLADGNYTFEVSDGTCCYNYPLIDALVPIVPVAKVGIPLCVGQATSVEISAGEREFSIRIRLLCSNN
jgi:hypothetical protein